MGVLAGTLMPLGRVSLGFADATLKDIKASDFGKMPRGVKTNSPAFVFGHLATYPDRILELIGRPDLARPDEGYADIFGAGKECIDDPDGKVYPPMEEIVSRFRERHQVLLDALAEVSDETFAKPNPNEKMKDRFPTIGITVTFMLTSHIMMHMGQVSAWRRCMGLGPCM